MATDGGVARNSSTVPVAFAVGTRVRTSPSATADGMRSVEQTGVIVDDFGEVLAPHDQYGRDWALTKRWAVALDSGSLVFRDDDELEHEHAR
ncbi:hypothetical protein JGU71_29440 [Antrihabitans sp. YC3-6]|uniref:Uncharacterized protein n=1 Tax=Antrihabitans stalagmiti TaxID=2799499 RepID=A0A934NX40_9NOCA|nr:hypothetical protein [Antrihabitans stalagmiti]